MFVKDLFVGMSDELLLSFRRAFAEFFVETLIETSNYSRLLDDTDPVCFLNNSHPN